MPSNHNDFPIGYKLGNNTSTKTFFTTLLVNMAATQVIQARKGVKSEGEKSYDLRLGKNKLALVIFCQQPTHCSPESNLVNI